MCQSAGKTVVICVGLHSLGNVLVIFLRSYHLLGTNFKLYYLFTQATLRLLSDKVTYAIAKSVRIE